MWKCRVMQMRRYTALASDSISCCLQEACHPLPDIHSWMDQRRPREKYRTLVNAGFSRFGRALFASRNISAGEPMLEVPRTMMITPEVISQNVSAIGNSKTRLSLFLLTEKLKGMNSSWAPYLQCLPAHGEIESTVFWKDEELSWIQPSVAYRETLVRRQVIKDQFSSLQESTSFPNISFADFMHTYATVTSRSWGDNQEVSSVSMIPFVDFLNHDQTSGMLSYDKEIDCAVAVANRDYAAGEEVFLCYCYSPNSTLAVDYGFALPNNPNEQVQVWLEIPPKDPLRQMKLEVLKRHNMKTTGNEDGSDSGGRFFAFREMVPGLKLPDPVSAFARVISANSVEDLEEMVDLSMETNTFYGCTPFRDNTKECKAMSAVLTRVVHQLELHETALETLLKLGSCCSARKTIAELVLQGEVRVLRSVKEHIEEKLVNLTGN